MKMFYTQMRTCIIFLSLFSSLNTHSMTQQTLTSDFQIYQFLLAKYNYLPSEIIQTIVINACNITEQKYGNCLDSVETLLNFIKKKTEENTDIIFTVNILKVCLNISGKSLCTIKTIPSKLPGSTRRDRYSCTALHEAVGNLSFVKSLKKIEDLNYCIDVLCQVSGKNLINFLCVQDSYRFAVLHHAVWFAYSDIVKKLLIIADDKALELTLVESYRGTPLNLAQEEYAYLISRDVRTQIEEDKLNKYPLIIKILKQY